MAMRRAGGEPCGLGHGLLQCQRVATEQHRDQRARDQETGRPSNAHRRTRQQEICQLGTLFRAETWRLSRTLGEGCDGTTLCDGTTAQAREVASDHRSELHVPTVTM